MKKILLILSLIICLSKSAYADGWMNNGLGGLYYEGTGAPTATENDVVALFEGYSLDINNYAGQFPWFDSTNKQLWDYVGGSNGALQWSLRGQSSPTINSNVSRTIGSNYTIANNVRGADCVYSLKVVWTLNALLSGSATANLEYSIDNGSNWIVANSVEMARGILNTGGTEPMNLAGFIPSNATTVRITKTESNMAISYVRGQEKLN